MVLLEERRERCAVARRKYVMLCYVMNETKARADAPAGDAVPRLLKCGAETTRLRPAFQTRSKKLEPIGWGFGKSWPLST